MEKEIRRSNYFIITGTPGSGKTTLIEILREKGYTCFNEPARKVIAVQRAIGGSALPEKDSSLFVELMLAESIRAYEKSKELTDPIFFDRGIPDNAAYAALFDVDQNDAFSASRKYLSNKKVFFLPPWRTIYTNDDERKMTFEYSEVFSELIRNVYLSLDYKIVDVPLVSPEARADFVISSLPGASS